MKNINMKKIIMNNGIKGRLIMKNMKSNNENKEKRIMKIWRIIIIIK